MELEMIAADAAAGLYEHEWEPGANAAIDPAPVIRGVVSDLNARVAPARISAKFHATLIDLFCQVCEAVQKEFDLNRVVLSGGCFQNATLLTGLIETLQKKKFEVYAHKLVPTNDGGIALGQAVVAANSVS